MGTFILLAVLFGVLPAVGVSGLICAVVLLGSKPRPTVTIIPPSSLERSRR